MVKNSRSLRARPKRQRVTCTRRAPPQNWMPVRRGRLPRNVECFPRVDMPIRTSDSTYIG